MRLDDETDGRSHVPEPGFSVRLISGAQTGTNPMITLVPVNVRVPRRNLPPFSGCGMPRVDIARTEVYGFHLAGDEASVPRVATVNAANEHPDEAHPKPLYRYLHDGRRLGLVSWMRPHRR